MKYGTRIEQLEEIVSKVAEGSIGIELTKKAFNLQSEKKRKQIIAQEESIVGFGGKCGSVGGSVKVTIKKPRKPTATK